MANSENDGSSSGQQQKKQRGRPFEKGTSGNPQGRRRQDHEFRADDWQNMITGVGTTSDRRTSTVFVADVLTPDQARELWRGNDIAGRFVSEPAEEALREGFEVEVGDEEVEDALGARLEESGAFHAVRQAIEFARAYGGAAIMPIARDGTDDLSQPFNAKGNAKIESLVVLEPRELQPRTFYTDIRNPKFRKPETWQLTPSGVVGMNGLGTSTIHESRLVMFHGLQISNDPHAHGLAGWDDSELGRMYKVLRDFEGAWDSTGLLVQDWQITLWKIRDLAAMTVQDKGGVFKKRINAAMLAKSLLRSFMIDAEHEGIERNSVNVTGLPDLLDRYAHRLAAAAGGYPLTRLMGQSPGGLNSTGESDTTGWYDFVGRVRRRHTPSVEDLVARFYLTEIDGPTKGREPELWSVCWPPLWQEDNGEEADTENKRAQTDQIYINTAVFSPEEIRKARGSGEDAYITVEDPEAPAQPTPEELASLRSPTGAAPAAALEPAKQAMNGAQIASMVDIVKAANAKEISRESAQAILALAFPVTPDQAATILGPENFEPVKPEPPAPFGGKPAGAPPPGAEKPPVADAAKPPGPPMPPDQAAQDRADKIEHRGSKWIVLSMEGEILGEHDTEAEAVAQLRAVEAAKHAAPR